MNLEKRDKFILLFILLLVFGYFYAQFFLLSIIDKTKVDAQGIIDNQNKLNKINNMVTDNKHKSDTLDLLKSEYDLKLSSLPKNARAPEITYDLKKQADKCGVTLISISFGEAADASTVKELNDYITAKITKNDKKGKLMTLPSSIVVSGGYANIMNFVDIIEKDNRIAKVLSVGLSAQDNSPVVQTSLSVDYFYNNDASNSSDSSEKPVYDFNKNTGNYGNNDPFK